MLQPKLHLRSLDAFPPAACLRARSFLALLILLACLVICVLLGFGAFWALAYSQVSLSRPASLGL